MPFCVACQYENAGIVKYLVLKIIYEKSNPNSKNGMPDPLRVSFLKYK